MLKASQHVITIMMTMMMMMMIVIIRRTRNQYASPPEGNAIPAGPLSDSDEMLCCCGIPIGPLC